MGFKEELDKEKYALKANKRPYETVSFIVFAILIIQQLFYLGRNLWLFFKNGGFFSTANITFASRTQNFFARIVNIDSSKWLYVIAAIVALGLYYFLIYIIVWNYLKKENKAKWTWTLFVVFGPTIFLAPSYVWFAIYAFRKYFFRFIKTVIEEYKAFDPKQLDEEDAKILLEEEEAARIRAGMMEQEVVQEEVEEETEAEIKAEIE